MGRDGGCDELAGPDVPGRLLITLMLEPAEADLVVRGLTKIAGQYYFDPDRLRVIELAARVRMLADDVRTSDRPGPGDLPRHLARADGSTWPETMAEFDREVSDDAAGFGAQVDEFLAGGVIPRRPPGVPDPTLSERNEGLAPQVPTLVIEINCDKCKKASPEEIGRQVREAIKAYERRHGIGWRRS